MQSEADPPSLQEFGPPQRESHGMFPPGQAADGSSSDVRTTFANAWSELQIQQQQLLEQQRQNLQLQCSFSDKFNVSNPFPLSQSQCPGSFA
jgi:hypothetical protein